MYYVELPDGTLVEVPDNVPEDEARQRIRKQFPQYADKSRTNVEAVTDVGASLLGGAGNLLQFPGQLTQLVPGLYGVGSALTKPGEKIADFATGLKSEGLKVREAMSSQAISEADKEGVLAGFATAISQTIKDPALLSTFIAGQLPQLLGPAAAIKVARLVTAAKVTAAGEGIAGLAAQQAANKVATRAAIGTGVAMQGADVSSDTLNEALDILAKTNPEMPEEQRLEMALTAARKAGALSALVSGASLAIPGASAIEKRLVGVPGIGRVKSALGEAGQEIVEEGGGQIGKNVALQPVDPTRELLQGVGSAAGLGAIGGGIMGGAIGNAAPPPELLEGQLAGETYRQAAERLQSDILDLQRMKEQQLEVDQQAGIAGLAPDMQMEMPSDVTAAPKLSIRDEIAAALLPPQAAEETETVPTGIAAALAQPQSDLTDIQNKLETQPEVGGIASILPPSNIQNISEVEPALNQFLTTEQPSFAQGLNEIIANGGAEQLTAPSNINNITAPEVPSATTKQQQQAQRIEDVGASIGEGIPVAVQPGQGEPAAAGTGALEGSGVAAPLPSATGTAGREAALPAPVTPMYHRSSMPILKNIDIGGTFTLKPGSQGAEGKGVYFSQNAPVKPSTAEGTRGAGQAAVIVMNTPSREGWYVSKLGKTQKFGKPRTWHTNNKNIDLRVVDINEVNGERFITVEPESVWVKPRSATPETSTSRVKTQQPTKLTKKSLSQPAEAQQAEQQAAEQGVVEPDVIEQINKQISGKTEQLGKVLLKITSQMGLRDVGLKIVSDLEAEGEYSNKLIKLAIDAQSPVRALRHESIHALKELGFFSDKQWSVLTKEAETKWIKKFLQDVNVNQETLGEGEQSRYDAYKDMFKKQGLSDQAAQEAMIEEAIADAFGDFDINGAPSGLISAILKRMQNIFASLRTAVGGTETAEQILKKAESGKLKGKPVKQAAKPKEQEQPEAPEAQEKSEKNKQSLREEPSEQNAWEASAEDKSKAAAYAEENGIEPYISEGRLDLPTKFSLKLKEKKGYGMSPLLGIPMNKDGTVTVYYHTTKPQVLAINSKKLIPSEGRNRIYVTNESSGAKILGGRGNFDQELDGSTVLLHIPESLLQIDQEYPDGRKDFFIPIAQGDFFNRKMQAASIQAERTKAIAEVFSYKEHEEKIAAAVSEYQSLDKKGKEKRLKQARAILKKEHNVGTLMTENGKLEKTRMGGLMYEGQPIDSMGLGLAAAQQISDKLSTCPNAAICEGLCLGETSGGNLVYGGAAQEDVNDISKSAFRAGPRMMQYLKTEALIIHPEDFAVVLQSEIDSLVKWDQKPTVRKKNAETGESEQVEKDIYQSAVRLNVTSDFRGEMWRGVIENNPNVMFYDYTKVVGNRPIADNHHLTYSSTGFGQVVDGEKVFFETKSGKYNHNWAQIRNLLNSGKNSAMAFSSKNSLPSFLLDEETGVTYKVLDGDDYDARFLDESSPLKQGSPYGVIVGLRNKASTLKEKSATKETGGFFANYDPKTDGDTVTVPTQTQFGAPPYQAPGRSIPIAKQSIRAPQTKEFKQWFRDSKIVDANGEPRVVYHGTARDINIFQPKQANAIFLTGNREFAEGFAEMSLDWVAKNYKGMLTPSQLLDARALAERLGQKIYRRNPKLVEQITKDLRQGKNTEDATDLIVTAVKQMLNKTKRVMEVYVRAEKPFDYENADHIKQVASLLPDTVMAEVAFSDEPGITYTKPDAIEKLKTGEWDIVESKSVQKAIRELGFDSFYTQEDGEKNIAVYNSNQIKSATNNEGTYDINNPDIRKSLRAKEVSKESAKKFWQGVESIKRTKGVEAAEEAWIGGVADFGDREAARDIQLMRGYQDYRDSIVNLATQHLAQNNRNQFYVYRYGDLGLKDEVLLNEEYNALDPKATTLSINFAKKFKHFAGFDEDLDPDANMGWMRISVFPEAIIMVGKQSENELVIDPNSLTPDAIEIIDESFEPSTPEARFSLRSTLPRAKSAIGNQGTFDVTNPDIRKSLSSKGVGYHAGNLGYGTDTALGRMIGGRSTGHFGTGTYFVGNREKLGARSESRPVYEVSLAGYNLARPRKEEYAKRLHDGLRIVNNLTTSTDLSSPRAQRELSKAAFDIWLSLVPNGVTTQMLEETLIPESIQQVAPLVDELFAKSTYAESASTVLMRRLGYEGVDVRHIDKYDNTDYGTVVYGKQFQERAPKVKASLRSTLPAAVVQRIDQTTTSREDTGFIGRMLNAISPGSHTSIRAELLNRYNQLGVIDKMRIKKMGGAAAMADVSAESAALLSDLRAGIVASALGVHDKVGGAPVYVQNFYVVRNGQILPRKYKTKALAQAAAGPNGEVRSGGHTTVVNFGGNVKGPLAIFAPLAAINDPLIYQAYQFWSAAKRGKRLTQEGREDLLTPADQAHANLLEKRFPEFVSVQKEWIKYNNKLVDYMVDTGVLSPEKRDIYVKYADYVPFYRQMEGQGTAGPKLFSSISGVKPPKALKGADRPLDDFLENVVRNTQAAVESGLKNVAAQRAVEAAQDVGLAQQIPINNGMPTTVTVHENGVPTHYACGDVLFINAMKSLGMSDIPFLSLLSMPANVLRAAVTREPTFMLANMLRDSLSSYVTSGVNMTPIVDTAKNFAKAVSGNSPEYAALRKAGVVGGYDLAGNIEESGRMLGQELKKAAGVKSKGLKRAGEIVSSPVTGLWQALEKGSEASDAATRIEIYKRTLAETGNETEALFKSLEVMNFNRKGRSALVRTLTAIIPFLNARMQGLDILYRTAIQPSMPGQSVSAREKELQHKFFVRGATMAALSCLYWALTSDDEEYKKQEQETKDNYWLIPSMGIKIPIPFEVGILFKVIPERIMALSFGDDSFEDFRESMTRQIVSTLQVNPIPQAAIPIIENLTNYSFYTGRPIVSQGVEDLEPGYQVSPSTSTIVADFGKATNISPIKLEHAIQGYTGQMGMYLVSVLDAMYDANSTIERPAKRFEQLPLIKRFAIDPEARGSVTAFYKLKDQVDSAVKTANTLERTDPDAYAEYLEENIDLLTSKEYINALAGQMNQLAKFKNLIRSSDDSAEEKRDSLLEIQQLENGLTENIKEFKRGLNL